MLGPPPTSPIAADAWGYTYPDGPHNAESMVIADDGSPIVITKSAPSWPHHALPDPPMIQSEGITADLSGCGYEVTSEEGPAGTRAELTGVSCR